MSFHNILAGKNHKDKEYANILGKEENATPLTAYIRATGRFRMDRTLEGEGEGGPSGIGRRVIGER